MADPWTVEKGMYPSDLTAANVLLSDFVFGKSSLSVLFLHDEITSYQSQRECLHILFDCLISVKYRAKKRCKMRRKQATTDYISTQYSKEPPLTPEEQDEIMMRLAYDLVEQRMRNGTASSQETVHFLKLSSAKERLERRKLEEEVKLLEAKTKYLESQEATGELLQEVLDAMREYSGGQ